MIDRLWMLAVRFVMYKVYIPIYIHLHIITLKTNKQQHNNNNNYRTRGEKL